MPGEPNAAGLVNILSSHPAGDPENVWALRGRDSLDVIWARIESKIPRGGKILISGQGGPGVRALLPSGNPGVRALLLCF